MLKFRVIVLAQAAPWQLRGLLSDQCVTKLFIWDRSRCLRPAAVPMPLQTNTQLVETVQLLP